MNFFKAASAAFFMVQRASLFDTIVFGVGALCFAGSFLIGNHYPPWMNAYNDLLAATALWFLTVATTAQARPLVVPRVAWAVVTVAALPLIQFAVGQIAFFGDGWVAGLYLLCLAAAIVSGMNAAQRWPRHMVETVCGCWIAVALLSCVITLLQRFQVDVGDLRPYIWEVRPGRAPFGNLGQPNQMATFLSLSLVALAYLFECGRIAGKWTVVLSALILVCVAMTQSRTAPLQLIVAVTALVLLRRQTNLKSRPAVVTALIAWWGACFLLLPSIGTWLGLSDASSLTSRLHAGPRTVLWAQLWEAALRHPWFGYGWNQVSVAQMAVATDFSTSRYTEHAHNLLLDLALWNGFPIALAITVSGAWWLGNRARRIRSSAGAFGLVFISLMLMHAMVEYPLDYLYFLIPFGWAIGVVEADVASTSDLALRLSPATGLCLQVLMGLAISLTALDYLHFEGRYRDLRLTLARVGVPGVSPADPTVRTQFTQLAALFDFQRMEVDDRLSASQLEWMGQVAARYPATPVLFRYAVACALNSDLTAAESTLRKMRRLHGERAYQEAKMQLRQLAQRVPQLSAIRLD